MIYYSIWPNQETLCFSVCTPDPQEVIGIIENVCFKAKNFMIFVKNSRGGREVNMINTVSKIHLSIIGGEVHSTLIKYIYENVQIYDENIDYRPPFQSKKD